MPYIINLLYFNFSFQFSSVQSLSRVRLLATPWIAAHRASLSITNSQSLFKLMSIESVMSFSHLILCHPLWLLPSILPSIRVFSNESALCRRWPKYWSFIFSISPSNEYCVDSRITKANNSKHILWLALLDYLYLSSFLAVTLGIDPCLCDSYLEQVTCTLLEFICLKEKRDFM